jgi:hypothetical protein
MAQTANAITWRNATVLISTDGTNFTDISGFDNALSVEGGDRQIAKLFTGDADVPIVLGDKRDSLRVTLRAAYTEGASDPFEVYRQAYENMTPLYVRWHPKSGDSGEFRFTTSAGVAVTAPYPGGEYGSGEVKTFEGTIEVASITKAVV